jgi:hypothetical protein
VSDGQITEVEHIISTRRNLSSPPTPIGEPGEFAFDPVIMQTVPPAERASRSALAAHLNGYFDTLQHNDGEIRGTCFRPTATRRENGMLFEDIAGGFRSGRYAFNDRVRREVVLIDEERQIAMGRGFIDHKGVLDEYRLTDGTTTKSVFQEPQSWGLPGNVQDQGRLYRRRCRDFLPGSVLSAVSVDNRAGPMTGSKVFI